MACLRLFLAFPQRTITATAKLVQMGKARVLPFTHKRLANCKGYEITIHPPLENYPTGNDLDDATRINQVIEQYIRLNPGQYLWRIDVLNLVLMVCKIAIPKCMQRDWCDAIKERRAKNNTIASLLTFVKARSIVGHKIIYIGSIALT